MFPWDSFILEVTFLTLWLPHTHSLLPSSITAAWAGLADAVSCAIAATTCSSSTAAAPVTSALASLASAAATSAIALLASIPLIGGAASSAASALTGLSSAAASPSTAASFSESIAMVSPPGALLAFMFRYALVRLLVGFGKMKFQGSTWRDRR